ncbi:hypothetical protein EZV62_026441 [Acer yangbiense]|uniref:Uncharacterized protein n=1 Tax=Acer yangbiense TaxID=1000413 RepID=A0A5C7GRR5_9ROSI|nr:hypothetical protein EZV62_026441 [Acer yangbiense]
MAMIVDEEICVFSAIKEQYVSNVLGGDRAGVAGGNAVKFSLGTTLCCVCGSKSYTVLAGGGVEIFAALKKAVGLVGIFPLGVSVEFFALVGVGAKRREETIKVGLNSLKEFIIKKTDMSDKELKMSILELSEEASMNKSTQLIVSALDNILMPEAVTLIMFCSRVMLLYRFRYLEALVEESSRPPPSLPSQIPVAARPRSVAVSSASHHVDDRTPSHFTTPDPVPVFGRISAPISSVRLISSSLLASAVQPPQTIQLLAPAAQPPHPDQPPCSV